MVLVSCFYPYRNSKSTNHCFALLSPTTGSQPGDQDKRHASSAPKRQTRRSVRQEGKSNPRKLTPGSSTPAVSRLKCNEGRILQADPRFQAVSRLSRPDKEENPGRNSRCTSTSPEGQTKTSGSQQPGHRRWLNTN
jgi:hypothetical protein